MSTKKLLSVYFFYVESCTSILRQRKRAYFIYTGGKLCWVSGHGPGRIRMTRIPDLSAPSLCGFVWENVQKGAELRTDALYEYNVIDAMGYNHLVINISDTGDQFMLLCHVFIVLHLYLAVGVHCAGDGQKDHLSLSPR